MKKKWITLLLLALLLLTASCTEAEPMDPFVFEGRWFCTKVKAQDLTMPSNEVAMEYYLDVYADGTAVFDMGTTETFCTYEETDTGYTINCFDVDFPIEVKNPTIIWNFNGYYMTFEKVAGEGVEASDADADAAPASEGETAGDFTEAGGLKGPLYDSAPGSTLEAGAIPVSLDLYEALRDLGVEKYYLTYADVCRRFNCHGAYMQGASAGESAVYKWVDESGVTGITVTFRANDEGEYLLYLISHDMELPEE